MSTNLLEILPLPWVIIGGGCAAKFYRKTLPLSYRELCFDLGSTGNIRFGIDFRNEGIRRIVIFVPHPSAPYYNPNSAESQAATLDASISFLLWLMGKQADRSSFQRAVAKIKKGIPGAAPFESLWSYRAREQSLGRNLRVEDLDPAFLLWATNYLAKHSHRSPSASELFLRGKSVLEAIVAIKTEKQGDTARQNNKLRGYSSGSKKGNATIYKYSYKPFWHGKEVTITKKGFFSIHVREKDEPLQLFGGRRLYQTSKESDDPVTIFFSHDAVVLFQRGKVIFKQPIGSIGEERQPDRWLEQWENERQTHKLRSKYDTAQPKYFGPNKHDEVIRENDEDGKDSEEEKERLSALADATCTRKTRRKLTSRRSA